MLIFRAGCMGVSSLGLTKNHKLRHNLSKTTHPPSLTHPPTYHQPLAWFQEPSKGVNPDEAVAMGAAIQAGVLKGDVKEWLKTAEMVEVLGREQATQKRKDVPSLKLTWHRTWKWRPPWKGDSYWKPSFLGAMLVFGRVECWQEVYTGKSLTNQ